MNPLLVLVLLAADPDVEWSDDPKPPARMAPASPPPAVAAETAKTPADHPLERLVADDRAPLSSTVRFGLQLDLGVSPSSVGQLGAAFDFAWFPIAYLRLHANIGSAWLPGSGYQGFTSRGAMRVLVGFDGVLPFAWGELFSGFESGTTYTDQSAYATGYGSYYNIWFWQPTMRMRGGFDVTLLRPLVLGFDVAYSLIAIQFGEMHWAEFHGRLGLSL